MRNTIVMISLILAQAVYAVDNDCDGIDDAFEHSLLQRFAPIIYIDEFHTTQEAGVGVPVSVEWFIQHVRVELGGSTLGAGLSLQAFRDLLDTWNSPDLRLPFIEAS